MQTDELRAELAELAREIDPFAEDLGAVKRRVARRRVANASVAVVIVVGLVAGGIALTRPGGNRVHVAASAKKAALSDLRFDAAVVLPTGATDADAARAESILDSTAAVEKYAPLSASALATLFQVTNPGAKLLHERACADPAIRSYAVQLTHGVTDPIAKLRAAVGAAATVQALTRALVDVDVFMEVHATAAQLNAVDAAIAGDPDVVKSTFLSPKDALKEFRKLFADQPDLIAHTTADVLPASYELEVREGVSATAVARRLQRLPGVKIAETPGVVPPITLSLHDACLITNG